MTAYDSSQWTDLFVATAGASAALAGLVFVAVSINIERILKYQGLPERALETVLLLLGVLLVSVVGLIPGQSHVALGIELLVVSLALGVAIGRLPTTYSADRDKPRAWLWGRWSVRIAGTLPFVVGGISVMAGSGGRPVLDRRRDRLRGHRRRHQRLGPAGRDPALGGTSHARPATESRRMTRCAGPTNAATPSSPAISGTSPDAPWRS